MNCFGNLIGVGFQKVKKRKVQNELVKEEWIIDGNYGDQITCF